MRLCLFLGTYKLSAKMFSGKSLYLYNIVAHSVGTNPIQVFSGGLKNGRVSSFEAI